MAGMIITGGMRTADGYTTRAYLESTGRLLWAADHQSTVSCICVDSDGNVYCGGYIFIKKYNVKGELQWSISTYGSTTYCIAVDSNGYVYMGTDLSVGNFYIRKYDSNGNAITTEEWPVRIYGSIRGICIDSNNDIYIAKLMGTEYISAKKYNSSGVEQWGSYFGKDLFAINVTGNYISTGGLVNTDTGKNGQVLDPATGGVISEYADGVTIYAIARNANADRAGKKTYIGGATLNQNFCITNNTDSGNVYTGGYAIGSFTTRKYTSAGVEITDDFWPLNHTQTVYAIAWTPVEPFYGINLPGLLFPIIAGAPFASRTVNISGLLLPLLLNTPDFSGILQPPDIYAVNYPVKIIYRLYVSGTTLVELPISSFQCKRSLGQSTFLTVVIPHYSNELVNLLELRKISNNILMIYSGYIDRNGDEMIGEFIKSTIIDIDVEQSALTGQIRVYGRVIPAVFTTQSRRLQNVLKRGKTSDGKRTITCSVDFNLRPNDTAIDGLMSWIVGNITLFVDSSRSRMDVVEN